MIKLLPILLILCFGYNSSTNDVSLFYVLSSNTNKLTDLKEAVEMELSHESENMVYQYISNGSQSITSKGYYDCKNSLKGLYTISPNQPSFITEINQFNDFISDEEVFYVNKNSSDNYKITNIHFFIPFETEYEFESFLKLFIERFLIANRIIVNNKLDSKFIIKVYSNLEIPESITKKFKNYEFVTY